jgi:hypothetical protein
MAHVGNFTFNVVRESRGSGNDANTIPLAYAERITGVNPRLTAYAAAAGKIRRNSESDK